VTHLVTAYHADEPVPDVAPLLVDLTAADALIHGLMNEVNGGVNGIDAVAHALDEVEFRKAKVRLEQQELAEPAHDMASQIKAAVQKLKPPGSAPVKAPTSESEVERALVDNQALILQTRLLTEDESGEVANPVEVLSHHLSGTRYMGLAYGDVLIHAGAFKPSWFKLDKYNEVLNRYGIHVFRDDQGFVKLEGVLIFGILKPQLDTLYSQAAHAGKAGAQAGVTVARTNWVTKNNAAKAALAAVQAGVRKRGTTPVQQAATAKLLMELTAAQAEYTAASAEFAELDALLDEAEAAPVKGQAAVLPDSRMKRNTLRATNAKFAAAEKRMKDADAVIKRIGTELKASTKVTPAQQALAAAAVQAQAEEAAARKALAAQKTTARLAPGHHVDFADFHHGLLLKAEAGGPDVFLTTKGHPLAQYEGSLTGNDYFDPTSNTLYSIVWPNAALDERVALEPLRWEFAPSYK
jgi:hypothetical protein